ncbi:hypothetical protein BXO88_07160 [Oribacterium sp. C9]|uniref:hypothetical protein n=1 Tax=Oribacterium sp. C9 TaxID=1943579 RepID=UPI00098FD851|nr:hypothetical protein [Oribacterium sp. C9]OON86530.1 hypothetical protein BXO88_07160 [Oribacterium sp. C9]
MRKDINKVLRIMLMSGFMVLASGTVSLASVVEVSTLPGTSETTLVSQTSAAGNYVNATASSYNNVSTAATPVVTAVNVLPDGGQGSSAADAGSNAVNVSSITVSTVSAPVITAASAIDAGNAADVTVGSVNTTSAPVIDAVGTIDTYIQSSGSSASAYVTAQAVAASSSATAAQSLTTPVVEAGSSSAYTVSQDYTSSEVGFCVLLGSSPTGIFG